MYAKGNILKKGTLKTFATADIGNVLSTQLAGNDSIATGYIVTDKYNGSLLGQILTGNPFSLSTDFKICYTVTNIQRVWVPSTTSSDGIGEGGKYELTIDPVNSIITSSYGPKISLICDKVPGKWIIAHPTLYTGSDIPITNRQQFRYPAGLSDGNRLKIALLGERILSPGVRASSTTDLLYSDLITSTASDPQEVFRNLKEITDGDNPYSNYKLRLGVTEDMIKTVINQVKIPFATMGDRQKYETGKIVITVGQDTVEIPLRQDNGYADVLNMATALTCFKDDAGFVRQLVYDNRSYNVPIMEIYPAGYGFLDEQFKIKNLSQLAPGDILAVTVKTIESIVGMLAPSKLGSVATAIQQIPLMPPEYEASIAYAMFSNDGLKNLGNSVLNMKEKQLTAQDLYPYIKGQVYLSYGQGSVAESVNVSSAGSYDSIMTNLDTLLGDIVTLDDLLNSTNGGWSGYFSAHYNDYLNKGLLDQYPADWISAFESWLTNFYVHN